jgi:hypothetical protein
MTALSRALDHCRQLASSIESADLADAVVLVEGRRTKRGRKAGLVVLGRALVREALQGLDAPDGYPAGPHVYLDTFGTAMILVSEAVKNPGRATVEEIAHVALVTLSDHPGFLDVFRSAMSSLEAEAIAHGDAGLADAVAAALAAGPDDPIAVTRLYARTAELAAAEAKTATDIFAGLRTGGDGDAVEAAGRDRLTRRRVAGLGILMSQLATLLIAPTSRREGNP